MNSTDQVINALRTVPPKRLLIIDLANRIPIKDGEFDPVVLTDLQPEINLAVKEAEVYAVHTQQVISALTFVKPSRGY